MSTATERVRVLRVIEYDFESLDAMNEHFAAMTSPLQGERRYGSHMTMRSTAMFPQGSERSLFTVESEAPAPGVPEGPVILLASGLAEALDWGQRHLDTFVVPDGCKDLEDVLSTHLDDPIVAIELSDWSKHPEWGEMRAALYYDGSVQVYSAQEWEETHG